MASFIDVPFYRIPVAGFRNDSALFHLVVRFIFIFPIKARVDIIDLFTGRNLQLSILNQGTTIRPPFVLMLIEDAILNQR